MDANFKKLYPDDPKNPTPNLAVVAILQNTSTKEVYQTAVALNVGYPPVVTGLESVAAEDIYVFPNPAASYVTVQLPSITTQPVEVRVIDQHGRVVATEVIGEGQQSKTISTQNLADGLYILHLSGSNGTVVRKTVVVVHGE